ncbi:MAG: PQQ-dependent sugar dehydrogenase [Candidatus Thermoplasmatota archaeon]|nr:PQQ-dependent sugar dehydrogenase [Candidatus Thermoplasmatota archaeon]
MVRVPTWTIVLLFFTASFAGCLGSEEEQKSPFAWQERVEVPCTPIDNPDLECDIYLDGFETPVLSIKHPTEEEIWIVDLSGNITSWDGVNTRLVANLTGMVSDCHYEQGLFGMAFDEDFNETGAVLLSYVENGTCEGPNESSLILGEAIVENGTIDSNSIRVLRTVEEPFRNHNGGHILHIGNHQYLWGVGDGGSAMDPNGNGQNTSSPLGAIHIMNYSNGSIQPVMQNNTGDPYILHHGLRNPWRFDVDPQNRLWIADVGQYCYEEINVVPLMQQSNFGWAVREGFHALDESRSCNEGISEPPSDMVDPILEYGHDAGNCSVTGGQWMDWGPSSLRDGYLYGDFCSGSVWLISESNGEWVSQDVATLGTMIVGFGPGLNGELLIFSWAGTIYNLS